MVAEIALHAKDLIADGWLQGESLRKDHRGKITARCAMGALVAAIPMPNAAVLQETYFQCLSLFVEVIGSSGIAFWNDAPNRTKQDVLDAFDDMARLAKERGL